MIMGLLMCVWGVAILFVSDSFLLKVFSIESSSVGQRIGISLSSLLGGVLYVFVCYRGMKRPVPKSLAEVFDDESY